MSSIEQIESKQEETKLCKRCDNLFPLSFFRKRSHCKYCQAEHCKNYKANNKEKIKAYNKKYKEEHKEDTKEYNKKYSEENREQILIKAAARIRRRRKEDINFSLAIKLRSRVRKFIFAKKKRSIEYIGCSIEQVRDWLESRFYKGMTWENHGKVWHIDHVMPCAQFDLNIEEHTLVCFNWTNLQPLLVEENLSKKDKLLWSDLLKHETCVKKYSEINNLDILLFKTFLNKLKSTKFTTEKGEWHLGNQDGMVKIF
jgi:hypothetical protein